MAAKLVILNVTPTEGRHDIYLVFLSPTAKSGSLMVVFNTVFKTADAGTSQNVQIDVRRTNLNEYAGKYKMTGLPFSYIEVSVNGEKLMMKAGENNDIITSTDAADKFDAGGKATLLFIRDEKNKVIRLQIEAGGSRFEGNKE